MSDESIDMGDAFTPKTLREITDALGISRRYTERQLLSGAGFGYIVADFVCAENIHAQSRGRVSLARGRKFPDGSLHLFVPEPSPAWRHVHVGRKVRDKNWPKEKTYVAFCLDEIPTDVPTILHCPDHGARSVDSRLILNAISEGTPIHRRVIFV